MCRCPPPPKNIPGDAGDGAGGDILWARAELPATLPVRRHREPEPVVIDPLNPAFQAAVGAGRGGRRRRRSEGPGGRRGRRSPGAGKIKKKEKKKKRAFSDSGVPPVGGEGGPRPGTPPSAAAAAAGDPPQWVPLPPQSVAVGQNQRQNTTNPPKIPPNPSRRCPRAPKPPGTAPPFSVAHRGRGPEEVWPLDPALWPPRDESHRESSRGGGMWGGPVSRGGHSGARTVPVAATRG